MYMKYADLIESMQHMYRVCFCFFIVYESSNKFNFSNKFYIFF